MRRLSLLEARRSYFPQSSPFDVGRFSRSDSDASPCEIFLPTGFETNYAYPAVIWLHGSGSSERELTTAMPLISDRNFVGAAPRGTVERGRGYAWAPRGDAGSPADVYETLDRVLDAVERLEEECEVSRDRIFLAGAHEAGELALRVALAAPERFAGAASLLGRFPRSGAPLGRWLEARELPMFIARCEGSTRYEDGAFSDDLRLLHSAGMKLQVAHFPQGDELATPMFGELNRWMMSRISTAVCG
jgi:phospholipase/carboxylesterase